MDFIGTGARLTEGEIADVAKFLDCEVAAVKAVIEVECKTRGFDARNRPVILFEPHQFYRILSPTPLRDVAVSSGVAHPDWKGIPYPKTFDARYQQLNKAIAIHETAALQSASWGLGQVMGFNFHLCGYRSVQEMVEDAKCSEANQLGMMARFIKNTKLDHALRIKSWARFARGYNGPGYRVNRYDEKLSAAYAKFKAARETPPQESTFMSLETRHQEVLRRWVDRYGVPCVSDEHSRQWVFPLAQQVNHDFPSEGWTSKRASESRPQTTDAICRLVNNRLMNYDLVVGGGQPGAWVNYDSHPEDITGQVQISAPPVDYLGAPIPEHNVEMIMTMFPVIAALCGWRPEFIQSADWIRERLAPTGYRFFTHCIGGPWVEQLPNGEPGAAINKDWPDYDEAFQRWQEFAHAYGLHQNMMTLFGGPVPTSEGKRHIDRIARLADMNLYRRGEVCNEWQVNGWDRGTVRELLRHAHSVMPWLIWSPSSPNLAHNYIEAATNRVTSLSADPVASPFATPSSVAANSRLATAIASDLERSANQRYAAKRAGREEANILMVFRVPTRDEMRNDIIGLCDGLPLGWLGIHTARDISSPWWNLANFNGLINVPLGDTEPEGPGASAGGDVSSARRLTGRLLRNIDAKAAVDVLHSRFGVFNGHLDRARWPQYSERFIWEHVDMDEICRQRKAVAERQNPGGGGGGGGTPVPGGQHSLSLGQRLLPGQRLVSQNGKYYMEYQVDGNLVIYEVGGGPIWDVKSFHTPGYTEMQTDSHFVVYDSNKKPRRASHTWGKGAVNIQLNDDGNLVIYGPGGVGIWSSKDDDIYDEDGNPVR